MKRIVLAALIVSASSAQAFDYREELSEGYKPNEGVEYEWKSSSEQPRSSSPLAGMNGNEVCQVAGEAWGAYGVELKKHGKSAHGKGRQAAYESTPQWWTNTQRGEIVKLVSDIWYEKLGVDSSGSFGERWMNNSSNNQFLNQFKSTFKTDLAVKGFVKGCQENL